MAQRKAQEAAEELPALIARVNGLWLAPSQDELEHLTLQQPVLLSIMGWQHLRLIKGC